MAAVKQDIKIEEGANFQMVVDVSSYTGSLSGATARMQIRPSREDATVLIDHVPTVDAGAKRVTVNIPFTQLEPLAWRTGEYDIEMSVNAERFRIVEGRAVVSPQVTRS